MKTCSNCNENKSLEDFYNRKSSKDGKQGRCKPCQTIEAITWNRANRAELRVRAKEHYRADASKKLAAVAHWAKNNPEKVKAFVVAKRKASPDKYRAISNAACQRYYTRKLKASPPWLNSEHWAAIKAVYEIAAELSWLSVGGLEVDHIVPLQGKDVSGLHVPWNLQVLPASLNQSKSNKFTALDRALQGAA